MENLAPFLPADRRYALAHNQTLPDRTTGTVLFADVSGFTPLTAALAQALGPQRGAEEMTNHLDRVCSLLIAEVDRYGGSVINFSGDAITCWFDENGQFARGEVASGQLLTPQLSRLSPVFAGAALRAAAAALAMQAAIQQIGPVPTPLGTEVVFAVKVSLAAGPVRRFLVGRPDEQRLELLAGATLDRIAAAEHLAQRGEIVIAPEVAAALGTQAIISERRTGEDGSSFAILTGLARPVPPSPWTDLPPLPLELTRQWLLPLVYQRLQSGGIAFLAELRQAVALFLKFGGLDYDGDDAAGEKLNQYISWVQMVLAQYGGFLLQLSIDDKGSYFYAVFGVLQAHEDDPVRAVAAAIELSTPPTELSHISTLQTGIGQGQVYTGGYGAPTRQTYGVMGNYVNIAARLMSRAAPGQILVTPHIKKGTEHLFEYAELGEVELKGVLRPMMLYTLRGRRQLTELDTLKGRSRVPMVGRDSQRQLLLDQLEIVLREGDNRCVIIEGEAGIGKSRLMLDLLEAARPQGVTCLVGAGDAIENRTAYHAWRPLFRQFFGLSAPGDDPRAVPVGEWRHTALEQVAALAPQMIPLTPLLNIILPLDITENDLTAQMSGEVRANNTHELLVGLLQAKARPRPLLIVLDDVHWLDSASWALTRLVYRDAHPVMLVLLTRPPDEALSQEYTALLESPHTHHLRLEFLAPADTEALVCQRLGVNRLPPRVANLIHEKAAGHPFFSEELAYALRDAGLIEVVDGECRVTPQAGALRAMDFPDTIQGVITSRIDRLPPQQQLTLKVASVIGRTFLLNALYHVYPQVADRDTLPHYLGDLEKAAITALVTAEPDLAYVFRHIITQEVAYGMLLYAQRQSLHQAVAEWYELNFADDLSGSYPLLAYHWRNANKLEKAVDYLEKAAAQALRNNANQEAIRFLQEAMGLQDKLQIRAGTIRLARWHHQLGEAHMRLGLMHQAQTHYEQSLSLLQFPPPQTMTQIGGRMVKQIGRQILHRLRPQTFLGQAKDKEAVALAARSYQELILIYYLNHNLAGFLHAILASLNLAERANAPRELAEGYATMCLLAGALPQLNLAPVYEPMAMAAAATVDNASLWGFVWLRMGTYHATVGEWARSHETTGQAIAHYERINDPRGLGDAINVLGILYQLEGNFPAAYQTFTDLYVLARKYDNVQHEGWGIGGQASSLLLMGDYQEALVQAEDALAKVEVGSVQEVNDLAVKGLALLRLGRVAEAVRAADQSLGLMKGVTPTAFTVIAFLQLGMIYLSAWEAAAAPIPHLQKQASQVIKVLHRFGIGKAAAWLCQGWYEQLRGRSGKAMKLWQKGLAAAALLPQPYEEAWLHHLIGRHLPPTDPARVTHLVQAQAIFTRLNIAPPIET
ncbi:MAG: AAA family ATPase [Anaerolineae bacterium]|nr:AAA family ATPase [Anaerolineae bacterium]